MSLIPGGRCQWQCSRYYFSVNYDQLRGTNLMSPLGLPLAFDKSSPRPRLANIAPPAIYALMPSASQGGQGPERGPARLQRKAVHLVEVCEPPSEKPKSEPRLPCAWLPRCLAYGGHSWLGRSALPAYQRDAGGRDETNIAGGAGRRARPECQRLYEPREPR